MYICIYYINIYASIYVYMNIDSYIYVHVSARPLWAISLRTRLQV